MQSKPDYILKNRVRKEWHVEVVNKYSVHFLVPPPLLIGNQKEVEAMVNEP